MKNKLIIIGYIGLSLVFGLFFSGCTSSNFFYDKSIPEEQLCILNFSDNYAIVKFDESEVKWSSRWHDEMTVKLPAGEHTLTINYFRYDRIGGYYITRTANDIKITFDFQPRKTYRIFSTLTYDSVLLSIMEDNSTGNY